MTESQGASRRERARKRVTIFLSLIVILSASVAALMSVSDVAEGMMFLLYGWVPAAAAALTLVSTGGSLRELGLGRAAPHHLLLALGLGWALPLVVYLPAWGTGIARFSPGEAAASSGSLFGTSGSEAMSVAAFVAIYATLGILFGSVLALGEEIGWRGLLVPELAVLTSFGRTASLTGLIWALWHLPVMIFFGYHSRAPIWYGVSCACVAIFLAGFPYAWLRLVSGSVWPVALFHGTHNILFQEVFHPLTEESSTSDYLVGEFGILVIVPIAALALAAWRFRGALPGTGLRDRPA